MRSTASTVGQQVLSLDLKLQTRLSHSACARKVRRYPQSKWPKAPRIQSFHRDHHTLPPHTRFALEIAWSDRPAQLPRTGSTSDDRERRCVLTGPPHPPTCLWTAKRHILTGPPHPPARLPYRTATPSRTLSLTGPPHPPARSPLQDRHTLPHALPYRTTTPSRAPP